MRAGLVVVGIVLAVIGAALLFVPVVPQSNETVSSSSSTPYVIISVGGYSLTGSVPVAVSWSTNGSTSVEVLAGACSATCNGSSSQISDITSQNGTSGSFTLNQPDGGSIIMGVVYAGSPAVAVTFKITTALSTVGTILVVVGILILILGVVLRRKPKASAASAPPTAVGPSPPAPTTPGGPPPST